MIKAVRKSFDLGFHPLIERLKSQSVYQNPGFMIPDPARLHNLLRLRTENGDPLDPVED